MIPRLGDGNLIYHTILQIVDRLENDSPFRGRKRVLASIVRAILGLENDSPFRGRKPRRFLHQPTPLDSSFRK